MDGGITTITTKTKTTAAIAWATVTTTVEAILIKTTINNINPISDFRNKQQQQQQQQIPSESSQQLQQHLGQQQQQLTILIKTTINNINPINVFHITTSDALRICTTTSRTREKWIKQPSIDCKSSLIIEIESRKKSWSKKKVFFSKKVFACFNEHSRRLRLDFFILSQRWYVRTWQKKLDRFKFEK